MNNYPAIFGAIFCNILAQLFMKYHGVHYSTQPFLRTIISWQVFAAILAYGLSFMCMLLVFKSNQLSVAGPITASLSLVFLCISSALFFNESFSIHKILGICFILVGSCLINR